MNHEQFTTAAYLALNEVDEVPERDSASLSEIVETHEPISAFRPVDVMSGKAAGKEIATRFGPVVVRRNVQKAKGQTRQTMFIAAGEDGVTLVGWD